MGEVEIASTDEDIWDGFGQYSHAALQAPC